MAELNELPLIGCMELTVSESWTELSEVLTEVLSEPKLPDSYRVKQKIPRDSVHGNCRVN